MPSPRCRELGILDKETGEPETLDGSRDSTLGESLSAVMDHVEQWSEPAGAMDDASVLAVERCG